MGAGILMLLLNTNPVIHTAIINFDMRVALGMNSVLGHVPLFDRTIGWLSTRAGDLFILGFICLLFAVHSFCGANLHEVIRRGSFWIWLGFLCASTYLISCSLECFVRRDTPLSVLHPFNNLQTMYGITFHSCPTSSFPSGHGMAFLFFAIMASWRYFRMSLLLWSLAILVLSLRLILGLHWLSDIICGSLFIVLILICLIEDTPLKNTYKYFERAVAVVVRRLLVLYKRFGEIFFKQHRQVINNQ
jgi:membrane-associated phospholipid phosphatase